MIESKTLSLLMALIGSLYSASHGKNYYLSPTGSDSKAGTADAPWATLGKAHSIAAAGDTVFLRGGPYSQSGVTWTKAGTAAHPIVLAAYPGEKPAFDGKGADWLMLVNAPYLVVDGLEATHYGSWAFQIADGSSYVTLRNCYLHQILAAENAAVVTRNCHHVVIEKCVFEGMGRSLDQTAFDHAVYNAEGGHDIVIRGNYFRDNYGGPAINHYHEPAPYNVSIYNNVFAMTKGAERSGVYVGDLAHDVHLYNNTFYLDAAGASKSYAITLNSGGGTNAVENNIFYFANANIQNALIGGAGDSVDYNMYYPAMDTDDGGAHSAAGDPRFVSVGNDFHLTAASPARKDGVALSSFDDDLEAKPRPAGAWDMGAFQSDPGMAMLAAGPLPRSRPILIPLAPGKTRIDWNPLPAGTTALRIFSAQGVAIGTARRDGNGFVWDHGASARGVFLLLPGKGGITAASPVFLP